MPSDEPLDDRCGAECKSADGYCTQYPVTGSERCRMHGGKGSGAPKNNGNAETHGMTAEAEKWFERHRDDVEDDVRRVVASWMQLAPFGWEVEGNVNLLVYAAINEGQIEQGDRYIKREGVVTEEPIAVGDSYVEKDVGNPAFLHKSRLQKDTIRILNKLDILDSPDSRQADAAQSVADTLAEINS